MKNIIILGSSGFVGKSLNDYLNKKYYKVTNISRSEKKNFLNINKLKKSDYIIYCIKNKNIKKSLKLFNHFKLLLQDYSKKTKILFFSSGAVYGPRHKIIKFNEKDDISLKNIDKYTGYKKNYAKEKILLEKEFINLSKEGFRISIARGFTFYGRYILNYNFLVSHIIHSIKNKKELTIDRNIFRSYMHDIDMCKWILKILKSSSVKCPIYNLGSDQTINLKNFCLYLSKKYNAKVKLVKKKNKMDYYIPSTNLAKKKLNLKTTINFKDGIRSLLN